MGPGVCSLCDRDIQKSIKVKCAECKNLILCFECIRSGVEGKDGHKSTHAYFVLDNLEYPLIMEDWTAKDELQLIQGIMKCGLGNWKDVAEQYVRGGKTAEQCEEHFFTFFNKTKEDDMPS